MDIREFSIRHSSLSRVFDGPNKMVVAIAPYYKANKIFWSDVFTNKIFIHQTLTDSSNAQVFVQATSAKSFSIDWITGNIYWISLTQKGTVFNNVLLSIYLVTINSE